MPAIITQEHPAAAEATALIGELDAHLEPLYPRASRHGFSVQKLIDDAVAFFVIREEGLPAGCAGIKLFDAEYGEIKRMYVRPQFRSRGLAKMLLDHLAAYALSYRVQMLRLETGVHQLAAIQLYEQAGFQRIPPFGPYHEDPLSRCYEKSLR